MPKFKLPRKTLYSSPAGLHLDTISRLDKQTTFFPGALPNSVHRRDSVFLFILNIQHMAHMPSKPCPEHRVIAFTAGFSMVGSWKSCFFTFPRGFGEACGCPGGAEVGTFREMWVLWEAWGLISGSALCFLDLCVTEELPLATCAFQKPQPCCKSNPRRVKI